MWNAFREDAKGHIITRLIFTGAYIWCDDYVRSPNLGASFHANPPSCPNGNLETEYERMYTMRGKTCNPANAP